MNKKKAKIRIGVIIVMALIGVLACFVQFQVPFTEYNYIGFAGGIESKLGLDLKGGIVAVYDTAPNENSSSEYTVQIEATQSRILNLLNDEGYSEATVQIQGTQIRIEVPSIDDPEAIINAIGEPATLYFSTLSDGSDRDNANTITSADIKDVQTINSLPDAPSESGVQITFTDEGASKFADLTADNVGSTLYIFKNDDTTAFSSPTINEAIPGGVTVISGGFSLAAAEQLTLQIQSGLYDVDLMLSQSSYIPATLGENALLAGVIAGIVGLIAIYVIMMLIYGHLGFLANISLTIYTVLVLLLIAVVDSVQLTLPGIAGIILSLGMAVDANVIIFERIKDEYKNGKRLPSSFESGFKKATTTILDSNITTIIASIILYIFGTGPIQGFAITLFIGIVVSVLCALVVTRSLAKTYLHINSVDASKLKLKRVVEGRVNGK